MSLRRKYIRNLVNELLFNNNIYSAPVNVEKIAKKLGAIILYEPAEDTLSGFLIRDTKKDKIIIGVNSNHYVTRQRFTIGHEIGHLLLHSEATYHIDKKDEGFSVRRRSVEFARNEESAQGTSKIEREANLFAAELLMPINFIERDMSNFESVDLLHGDELIQLAKKYEVSNRALTYRLANLGYIDL